MLTIAQKLDYIPAALSVALTFVWAVLTVAWRAPQYPTHWLLHIGYSVFRKSTARFSALQMQYVLPSTNLVYNAWIRSVRQKPLTLKLDHGAMGHWIGDPNSKNILVWYHGGGFALPANIGYFKFFAQLVADAERHGHPLAIFALTYTLAPVATYPTQLRQAVEALRYILVEKRHAASNVMLGGDSAGGNLVGGVLSHLAHPHPAIDPIKLKLDDRLAGAVMIAPWTLLQPDMSGRVVDSRGDLITPRVGEIWGPGYLGGAPNDFYTDLSNAPIDWYANFPIRRILVCGGEREILFPVIEDFVEKLRQGFKGDVEFCIGKGEGHVAPVYNLYLGDKRETQQGAKAKAFIRELLEKM
ncbi:Alpha/Beta hydrolase protein [Aspergillus pseudodeflectus]|uniref:Alpha/Beta hydrolase protein n=1 Tax=Aspergillus pseudodeflectus TaxID=176178 RepID=A0ABR4KTF1_9EURO